MSMENISCYQFTIGQELLIQGKQKFSNLFEFCTSVASSLVPDGTR